MSHWSSGLTICFLPQGAAVRTPGLQPIQGNSDYLLAPTHYCVTQTCSLITGYYRFSLFTVFAATLATLLVPVLFSLQATDYGDILLGSCKAHTCFGQGGGGWTCTAPAFLPFLPCLTGPVD